MANLVKQEGDFTYWDDGAVRYAKGNSLGKTPGSLAERNGKYQEKAIQALAQLSPKQAQALKEHKNGHAIGAALADARRENQTARKLEAQRQAEQAMMHAAAASSPGDARVPAEAWGLLAGNLTERALLEENTGHAVSAVGMLGKMTGYLTEERGSQTHIERMQVIVLDQDTAELLTQRGGLLLPDVVEGEFREPTETGGASDDG